MRPMPRFRSGPLAVLACSTALLSACDSQGPNVACTAVRSIAIQLTVTDSVTGVAIADSAFGQVVAGLYTDSLHHVFSSPALLIGGDSLGTYDVTLSRSGYATWTRAGIAVTQVGVCGNVRPVALDALLQPLP